jgi:hypothetical protein
MEVGILPAYPRRIAASEAKVLCVSLIRIEALVVLVIGAAKMLIPDMVGQSAMHPKMAPRPGLSCECEHWRGNSGGDNGYRAQCFRYGHWLSPSGESRRRQPLDRFSSTTVCIDTKTFFIFAASGIRGHINNTIRIAALGARPTI